MARLTLNPENPPRLTAKQRARLEAMTPAQLARAAKADADNPPLSAAELARLAGARRIREVRAQTGLSQVSFAKTYRINVARLRDLEQGRTQPDSALMAYLTVIGSDPDRVRRALKGTG